MNIGVTEISQERCREQQRRILKAGITVVRH